MKNKIINLSVAVALIIVCIFTFITSGDYSIAGAGNGKNARVKTIEEFAEVLEFLDPNNRTSRVALASSLDIDDYNYTPKYTSATVRVTSSIKAKSSSTNSRLTNGVTSSTQTLERELTCYVTEEATYYESKGVSNVRIYYDYEETKEIVTFDMDIMVTKENCFINFHEFSCVTEKGSVAIKAENKDKWINMPYVVVESFIDIDLENREVFA